MYSALLVIIYLAFISLGLPDTLLGSAWPQMHIELNASLSSAGIITMIISLGTVISSLFSDRLNIIARAILKNAPILILDEATAFADPDNEVRVQQALSALSKGKTVLMIAHRLSSITGADCIYVMQNGEIAESGTHDELIRKNGMFTHMWKNYSEAAEWKIEKEAEL